MTLDLARIGRCCTSQATCSTARRRVRGLAAVAPLLSFPAASRGTFRQRRASAIHAFPTVRSSYHATRSSESPRRRCLIAVILSLLNPDWSDRRFRASLSVHWASGASMAPAAQWRGRADAGFNLTVGSFVIDTGTKVVGSWFMARPLAEVKAGGTSSGGTRSSPEGVGSLVCDEPHPAPGLRRLHQGPPSA